VLLRENQTLFFLVPFAEIKHPTKRFSQAMKPGLSILPRLTHVGHDTPQIGHGIILDPYPKSKAAVARKVRNI